MIPAAPNNPVTAPSRTGPRGRRPDFRGRRHGGPSNKQGQKFGLNLGSTSSSVSSGWLYTGPEIEAQMAPDGPAHPYQQGNQPKTNCEATADGIADSGREANSCCIPPSIMAELHAKSRNAAACTTTKVQGWGSFCSVVLPAEVSCTRTQFDEKKSSWQQDSDGNGGGREKRLDVSTSLGKHNPGASPRAREQAKSLSTAMQGVLCGVRSSSRPDRAKLTKAVAVDETEVLHLASGARMGLEVISALEGIVSDEGEVFESCFRTLVQQERSACRERGELIEVMRGHYASLLEEVVERLSQLKSSLENTLDEEERLKQQAYSVQRLSKLLAENAQVEQDHRRKLASMPQTDFERFVACRHPSETVPIGEAAREATTTTVGVAATTNTGAEGEQSSSRRNTGQLSPTMESLSGMVGEVRSTPREETTNKEDSNTDRTRHVMASIKVDLLYDMIEERAAAKREQQRREKWREYNAATTIKIWWRKLNPPEWEETDRQYAATLIQARARGWITRVMRKQALEEASAAEGRAALTHLLRQYLAVKERKKRARVVQLALGAGLRVLGRAIDGLETKASALEAEAQGSSHIDQRKLSQQAQPGGQQRASLRQKKPSAIASCAGVAPRLGTIKAVVDGGAGSIERARGHTVNTLVERLNALGNVLDKCKANGRHASVISDDLSVEDGGRGRTSSVGITGASCSSSGGGSGRKGNARRRQN